jgi:WD40 repeat protein
MNKLSARLKSTFFLLGCFVYLACQCSGQANETKTVVADKTIETPILWTVDWSSNGKLYAIGGDDRLLRIYTAKDFKLSRTYELGSAIQCLDWNETGNILAVALDDNHVQLLNIETGQFLKLKETTGSRALAWNHTGELLAVGDYTGALQIYSKEGHLLKSIKKDNSKTYLSVDWHPKKNILLTGGDKIRIFDTSGTLLQSIKHRTEETIILTVKWHPGGTYFATGDYGHKEEGIESLLQFWSADGKIIKSLSGSKAEYRNIRWNKGGTILATASDAIRLWTKDGQLLFSGQSENLLWGIDWDNQGKSIITTSEKGNINLWTDKAELLKELY